jgi:predicted 2-oxoglutarate/Fe(II)-dependent dioxygenase YbiX
VMVVAAMVAVVVANILIKDAAIPAQVCDEIVASLRTLGDGTVLADAENNVQVTDKTVRVVTLMHSKRRGFVNRVLAHLILNHVEPFFKAEMEYWNAPVLLKYTSGGFYLPHVDGEQWKSNDTWIRIYDRDYSIVVFLNEDYEGGNFVLPDHHVIVTPQKGRLVAFPSSHFYRHGAEKTISGERFQLVSWLTATGTPRTNTPPYSGHLYRKDFAEQLL